MRLAPRNDPAGFVEEEGLVAPEDIAFARSLREAKACAAKHRRPLAHGRGIPPKPAEAVVELKGMCASIARQAGGTVSAASEQDQGSTFRVYLPLATR